MNKDLVTNLSTALINLKDLATSYGVPIEIRFENHWIDITIAAGMPYQEHFRCYPQDLYRLYSKTDEMRNWIEDALEKIRKKKVKCESKPMKQLNVEDSIYLKAVEGYETDWTPPELEKLGIPYPATIKDIERALRIEHLWDITCSWDLEKLFGQRVYMLMPGCTLKDLTPYERILLKESEEYQKNNKE